MVNNNLQTLDDTKMKMQVFLEVAGIGGRTQAQMDGFPAKYCPRPAIGETGRHEQLLQLYYASERRSDTVSSLLLTPSTPSAEV